MPVTAGPARDCMSQATTLEISIPPFVAVILRVRICICNGFAKPLFSEDTLTGVLLGCVYQPGSGVRHNLEEEESCHLQHL